MLEKLSKLIAKCPALSFSPSAPKVLAEFLIENGIAALPRFGSEIFAKFDPGQAGGTMNVDGEEFPVYILDVRAEQFGRIDVSTVAALKVTPSAVKRVFTIVEI